MPYARLPGSPGIVSAVSFFGRGIPSSTPQFDYTQTSKESIGLLSKHGGDRWLRISLPDAFGLRHGDEGHSASQFRHVGAE